MARKIRLYSPFDPIALATILKEEMDRKWTADEKKNGRVMGGGTEDTIMLHVARHKIRNDFTARLIGTMEAEHAGTLIKAKFGRAKGLGCFSAIWLGLVSFFLLSSLFVLGSTDAPFAFKLAFTGVPLLMLIFGILLFVFAGKGGPDDEKRILEFLRDKVKANEERSSD